LPGDDEDYELLDAQGKMVARVRQEGDRWWVARPRCFPEPPLEPLDAARCRATHMALMAMPSPVPDRNRELIKAVRREQKLYPWRFSNAGERYARQHGTSAGGQWQPATPSAWAEMPDIPNFLRGYHARSDPGQLMALHGHVGEPLA
jgi:hypothetical protein